MPLSLLNFDIGLVLFYLLLTLGIGVYKGWGVKTLKDFSIGKSEYSNIALIATITATWIGGASTIGVIEGVYSYGIIWFVVINAQKV